MRNIGIRELRKNLGNELDELPLEVVKRGRRKAVVVDPEWYDDMEGLLKACIVMEQEAR